MMLKTRIIPTLLWKGYGLVKGTGFDSWRPIGAVLPAIKVYNARHVDELLLLDIAATKEGREPDYESIDEFTSECFVPLTYGGGIASLDHIRKALLAGADKVCLNTAAVEDPELVRSASDRFGAQCVVVSIDARKRANGQYECCIRNGTQPTEKTPAQLAREMEQAGAGEILLASVERDGTLEGYDVELLRSVSEAVSLPVIASGGCSGYENMYKALIEGGASAVAAGALFSFTECTPLEAKRHLQRRGVPVRIPV